MTETEDLEPTGRALLLSVLRGELDGPPHKVAQSVWTVLTWEAEHHPSPAQQARLERLGEDVLAAASAAEGCGPGNRGRPAPAGPDSPRLPGFCTRGVA